MLTENSIRINGEAARVFELAADVLRWPQILPHYRWVKLISQEGRRRVVEMAAQRDGIPVKWTSVQEPIPEERRILFTHVKGPTTGMEVEWSMREEMVQGAPLVLVTIRHLFVPPWPIVGGVLAKHVVGRFFVHNIAGKTLARIKWLVESNGAARGENV